MLPTRLTGMILRAPAEVHRVGIDRRGVFDRHDQPVHSGAFGAAGDGTEIAHIGHPVENDQQWCLSFGDFGEHFMHIDIFDGRGDAHGALVVASRKVVQLFDRHPLHADVLLFAQLGQFVEQYAVRSLFQVNFFELAARFDRFDDRAQSEQDVFLFHRICYVSAAGLRSVYAACLSRLRGNVVKAPLVLFWRV